MAKVTILLIVALASSVFAKPYEVTEKKADHPIEEIAPLKELSIGANRFSDDYLIQLYERFLHIQPLKHPGLEDQHEKQEEALEEKAQPDAHHESGNMEEKQGPAGSNKTELAEDEERQESNIPPKDAPSSNVEKEGKKNELDEVKESESKELKPKTPESLNNDQHRKPNIKDKAKSDDKVVKQDDVKDIEDKERRSPLVQINVNVGPGK
ncbi:uncharacterized protein LOC120893890 [Anopheles arabiensis]|uniref:uncharacterized protein LOC120893890 n=1 Tax=Anopheles arabiensis TaxID=7173 RepID=UPI001AACFC9C|nr:uncharacterized protein LOC120893890 [Anopheles arabiensis]